VDRGSWLLALGGFPTNFAEQGRLMKYWKTALPLPIIALRLDDWVKDFEAPARIRTIAMQSAAVDRNPQPDAFIVPRTESLSR